MVKKYEFDPDGKLQAAIDRAIFKLGDLRMPFKLMTNQWYKANRSIFDEDRKSRGKYAELSTKYKKRKEAAVKSAYPILLGFIKEKGKKGRKSGKLRNSMIYPHNKDAIARVINKRILILGTKVTTKKGAPYAIYLHNGTRLMPARPIVLLGPEQVATKDVQLRRQKWIDILESFVGKINSEI